MDNTISTIRFSSIVEIDETLIAIRKNNRVRLVEKQWLFGAIEIDGTELILKTVERKNAESISRIMSNFITQYAIIYRFEWPAYLGIFNHNTKYTHYTVNH
ncbi:hypothetical protein DMUE_1928 [Dictyocoela muelleri]|nr:hypothetical protein DMUE_1928 [Dictyocoela muelleri]